MAEGDKSCWTCQWQVSAPDTFLGHCTKKVRNNPKGRKEIPPDIVDVGCKHWELREQDSA
jgi:hypothetical protein